MPVVTIYPAYSQPGGAVRPVRLDAPEATTALRLKRAVGHSAESWLYARLPRHSYDAKCPCYYCTNFKSGRWDRLPWAPDARPSIWPYVRADIGPRNVRLKLAGGEHFVCVALPDMPLWAAELTSRGRYAMGMAVHWYQSADRRTLALREDEWAQL